MSGTNRKTREHIPTWQIEVDVASQGNTVAEARDNLIEALTLFFETASEEEVDRRMKEEVYITNIEVAIA